MPHDYTVDEAENLLYLTTDYEDALAWLRGQPGGAGPG